MGAFMHNTLQQRRTRGGKCLVLLQAVIHSLDVQMFCQYFFTVFSHNLLQLYAVLTAASIKITVIYDVTPFSLEPTTLLFRFVKNKRRLMRSSCCLCIRLHPPYILGL
jgi:hypothetical protein